LSAARVAAAVVDRSQRAAQQVLGDLIGINEVAFVARSLLTSAVTDDHPMDLRLQEIVQPLRLGAFLEGDVHTAAHRAEELEERHFLGRHDRTGEDASAFLSDRGDGSCLMHVESYILGGAFHEGRSWVGSTVR
jgi:hypothetical protein